MNTNPLWAEFMSSVQKMRWIHHALKWNDISNGEFMILMIIHHEMKNQKDEKQPAGISVSALTTKMNSSQPAVSRLLKSMEEKKYICRTIDTRDRRNIYVTLTASGEAKREKVCARFDRIFNRVVDKMGSDKMKELISLWDMLAVCMQEEIEIEKEKCNETDI